MTDVEKVVSSKFGECSRKTDSEKRMRMVATKRLYKRVWSSIPMKTVVRIATAMVMKVNGCMDGSTNAVH